MGHPGNIRLNDRLCSVYWVGRHVGDHPCSTRAENSRCQVALLPPRLLHELGAEDRCEAEVCGVGGKHTHTGTGMGGGMMVDDDDESTRVLTNEFESEDG